jgi:hypothetical protein
MLSIWFYLCSSLDILMFICLPLKMISTSTTSHRSREGHISLVLAKRQSARDSKPLEVIKAQLSYVHKIVAHCGFVKLDSDSERISVMSFMYVQES